MEFQAIKRELKQIVSIIKSTVTKLSNATQLIIIIVKFNNKTE